MCARYQTPSQAAAERYWQVLEPLWHFEPSWRVLPTDPVPVVLSINGATTGRMMRWGLLPFAGETKFPTHQCDG
jgi:putative SOS response-associated peptidase YedK